MSLIDYFDKKAILKQRFRKTYRHPTLDQKLLSRRLTQEVRCLSRAYRTGVNCPAVYFVDAREGSIIMEQIVGEIAKVTIMKGELPLTVIGTKIGELIATAHETDLIHGDLTTSNIIFRSSKSESESELTAVLIDFGLAQVSALVEDKAVDLYVLERAISSTHPESKELFSLILQAYSSKMTSPKVILDKLAEGTPYFCVADAIFYFSSIER